jgi:bifunctional DNA-binding transcriptional regulator/antitoxin component of YhaV-PrlF toxin-antitoxin module
MVNPYNIEVRRVQALHGERSFTLVFPKEFAVELGVGKGDFLKCHINNNRLIVEKVKVDDEQEI